MLLVVALACDPDPRRESVEVGDLVGGESHGRRRDVLLDAGELENADDPADTTTWLEHITDDDFDGSAKG